MQTLQIADTTGESSDEPITKSRARDVEKAFKDLLGADVDLVERMSAPEHVGGVKEGSGITLNLSDWADKTVRSGFDFFSLERELEDFFGPSEGSSNVTTLVLKKDLSVRQVIAILADNGDLERAIAEIENNKAQTDPPTMVILAYTFLKYSLGWTAEKVLRDQTGFKKGNVAQDAGGIDGWYEGRPVQLKPVPDVGSKGRGKLMKKDYDHLAYAFDQRGGMMVAELDEFLGMMDELAEVAGVPKTLLYRSEDLAGNDMERPFRYTWW